MNYFAHALPFLDRPLFVAGACVPDWLTVADRPLRLRPRHAEAFLDDADPGVAEVAAGVLQHLGDDARFHKTRAFAETSLELAVLVRDALAGDGGMRPAFLGHLLVELLLDATLIADDTARLTQYYQLLDDLDAGQIEAAVNRMAPRPTRQLAWFIESVSPGTGLVGLSRRWHTNEAAGPGDAAGAARSFARPPRRRSAARAENGRRATGCAVG